MNEINETTPTIDFSNRQTPAPVAALQKKASFADDTPPMVKWVKTFSFGLIKTQEQANIFLLTFAIIGIAFAIWLFAHTLKRPAPPSPDEIIPIAGPDAAL
jgi:hypothetical protein